ncbi:DUF885 domain-containing protein [Corynebacterium flavescens]|uniref:DUF885 domain-containing protein n=1 Tax=Corynebacterium flavescens TaxID=28028 RepID=UPI002648F633|nr:DUF885 domain-containing protein [Corynebacterium flavescens]MDN6099738.1 DUF885 domain-containing protein [Corynebacterium flavescens]MDN6431001.1 DUF885 domain-containing protein [Corynebacterium flavescens]MDN6474750.1 DUF885 domain-containing protein [Corynebacterium flavescens]MDN6531456.1 DUF885 domain-containing protein [Corynebacterium flavescens]MDN6600799.1 DUF885 domain-containing protein [Corynebacterium flavescens]
MSSEQNAKRQPSLLDASCDNFVHDLAELSPTEATAWGIPGYEGELQDFSPAYFEEVADRTREMMADLDALDDTTDESDDEDDFDDVDYVTAAVLRDRLCLELDLHHHGEDIRSLNNIASPVQTIRDSLLLMPQETDEDHEAIRSRLSKVGTALHGYRDSLVEAASRGMIPPQRQISEVIVQCERLADADSMLDGLGVHGSEIDSAKTAFGDFSDWLSNELQPQSSTEDAVGRERYERFSRLFVGDTVNLDEAYEWGLQRLQEIRVEQEAIAHQLYGSECSTRAAMRNLNQEERYQLRGTEALVKWMQETADNVITELNGSAFDIPEEILDIECCIDPAGTGGIFYTPPADNFSRPGRMWWSVPAGQDLFHTWQELTTVHHEGVPGHHLQIGTALVQEDLNLWRRAVTWNSGHGEGWALYAEQLMADMGYLEDPGFRMGLLDSQRLRAARVVVDIGLHLGKKLPDANSSGKWDKSHVKTFMRENTAMDDANLNFEVTRYLGWPGQAPSYALGERLWQNTRDSAVAQGMEVKDFHSQALALGSVPMSILRDIILN